MIEFFKRRDNRVKDAERRMEASEAAARRLTEALRGEHDQNVQHLLRALVPNRTRNDLPTK